MTLPTFFQHPAFRALATCFIPDLSAASGGEWTEFERIVARAIAARPPAVERQLRTLISLIDWVSLLRYGTRLERLDAARRTRLLESLANSRVLVLRRGIWGLRTLCFMGWYTQAYVAVAIGYRAHPDGWEARR